jgi:hypothetical protein
MSDIADDIRRAVNAGRPDAPPSALRSGEQLVDDFMKLRAHVRGTLIYAHRELVGDEWSVTDDRVLDAVTNWLESKRGK